METAALTLPGWLESDDEFLSWKSDPVANLTSKALNAIGYSLSFAWLSKNTEKWQEVYPGVDLNLARRYFERAADNGHWPALNNLGVMYLEGLGVECDPVKAFELFQKAAQSLDPTPLRHLANCYRDGIGCDRDKNFCAFLEEIISIKEKEDESDENK